jgi:hypothetical protein
MSSGKLRRGGSQGARGRRCPVHAGRHLRVGVRLSGTPRPAQNYLLLPVPSGQVRSSLPVVLVPGGWAPEEATLPGAQGPGPRGAA